MDNLILFGVFVMLLMIGVPVAFSLAAAALATLAYIGLPPLILAQQVTAGAGSASLVAIPLFILAGEIMMRGGISERLIGLASAMVGRMRGGLGQVSIVSSLFFGGVSGSAIADVSAVGGAMIPQMVQRVTPGIMRSTSASTPRWVSLSRPPTASAATPSAWCGTRPRKRSSASTGRGTARAACRWPRPGPRPAPTATCPNTAP